MRRLTQKQYHELAEQRGFKWCGNYPGSTRKHTMWKCSLGHKWVAAYANIQYGKSGCPVCAGNSRVQEKDYHLTCRGRDIAWAGKALPKNNRTKTDWVCLKCSHAWRATYGNINRGRGCPSCAFMINGAKASSAQVELAGIVYGEINHKAGRKHIDVALQEDMIALEYGCHFWHGGREEEDQERIGFLNSLGWSIITIRTSNKIPAKQQLEEAIEKVEKGAVNVVVTLEGWGVGRTAKEVWEKDSGV